jgi:hypothetical protein
VAYARSPLPSPEDDRVMACVTAAAGAAPRERAAFRDALTGDRGVVLGRFGFRAATLAARTDAPELLTAGLAAFALAIGPGEDPRDVMVTAAVYHVIAVRLGVDPAQAFDRAAELADPAIAGVLRAFGRRTGIDLRSFGWRELPTAEGPEFVPVPWH